MSSFIQSVKLNPEQYKAATTTEGALLILAGAGSGKTRVLTHRIAHLLLDKDVSPYNILAITFTNKAANEMKERVLQMCPDHSDGLLIATFHSACVRILRRDIQHLDGYDRNFTIFDDDDTSKLINEVCKQCDIDTKQFPVKLFKSCISNAKNAMKTVADLEKDQFSPVARLLPEVYKKYQAHLKKNNALDFDDLILKTIELFTAHPDVLERYQHRFKYIMVDEYQDTNHSQYQLVHMLGAKWKNVCVVGDDDQSIYSWRGADVSIIRNFQNDYTNATIIKLEQNYRSTTTILNAANAVICNNTDRTEKHLWSQLGEGEKISYQLYDDDRVEAAAIARIIAERARNGGSLSDCAILYRTNSTSRNLESALMARGIPYRIYGGHRFYERAEVKDALAYLRALVNPKDEISLIRIINVPKRGIGNTTVAELSDIAFENNESLFTVIMFPDDYGVKPKNSQKLKGFISIIEDCASNCMELPPAQAISYMLERTGLKDQYANENTEEAEARLANLSELVNDAAQFSLNNPEGTLEDYLEQVALVNDIEAQDEKSKSVVNLMTIHSAKGLEFGTVFIAAFEDGIFPISRAFDSQTDLEEERRLAYVAITRAKRKLYISASRKRMLHGYVADSIPSRFLREIPSKLMDAHQKEMQQRPMGGGFNRSNWGANNTAFTTNNQQKSPYIASNRNPATVLRQSAPSKQTSIDYTVGQMVRHKFFGDGRIIGIKGSGKETIIQIAFQGKGIKELAAAFAPLEKL